MSIPKSPGATYLPMIIMQIWEAGGKVSGNQVWWNGPESLVDPEQWPPDILTAPTPESECEAKAMKELFSAAIDSIDDFDELLAKFPLMKAIRVIAWIHRFVFNCRAEKESRHKGPLITEEINKPAHVLDTTSTVMPK